MVFYNSLCDAVDCLHGCRKLTYHLLCIFLHFSVPLIAEGFPALDYYSSKESFRIVAGIKL